MHKTDLVNEIARRANLTKTEAGEAVNALFDTITDALAREESVSVLGFGSFVVRERGARQGKNPRTGEPLTIPASKTAAFKPGKALKERVG